MQLCGFHCISRYSICILVIVPMYFYHLLRLPCVPQGVPVANKCQMWSDVMIIGSSINIFYHRYQEWLGYQTFTAFLLKFHIFVYFGNFIGFHCWLVMTCVIPSQCHTILLFLMPVIQLIYSSSVEAHLLWSAVPICYYRCSYYNKCVIISNWTVVMLLELHGMFYM